MCDMSSDMSSGMSLTCCDMPCDYNPNLCVAPTPIKGRRFTNIMLYCWQTEYDARPYRNFQFRRLDFEERMFRKYQCVRDFRVIVNYLLQRKLLSVSISSILVSNWDVRLLQDFVRSLLPVKIIELKIMQLPREFFVMLRLNARKMFVKELSLEGTPLSEYDVRMLHEFLLVSTTLESLNVSRCSINQYNFALIADGVHKSKSLRSFHISRLLGLHMTLDTEKLASLIGSLLMQNKLVKLTLKDCELSAEDIEVIAEYLSHKNCKLRDLNLAYNLIGPDGVLFLMRAIVSGENLELLDISCNSIGKHGGKWIAKYLSSCKMLQHLYLNDNQIDAPTINLILLTLKKPCKIRQIKLYGNQFDVDSAKILHRLLDAEVVEQNNFDISSTYDKALERYRIISWF